MNPLWRVIAQAQLERQARAQDPGALDPNMAVLAATVYTRPPEAVAAWFIVAGIERTKAP